MVLRQLLLHPPAYVMPEPQMLVHFSRQMFNTVTSFHVRQAADEAPPS